MERAECVICGEVLGTYEPIVIRTPEGERRTSLVKEPALGADGGELLHADCSTREPRDTGRI